MINFSLLFSLPVPFLLYSSPFPLFFCLPLFLSSSLLKSRTIKPTSFKYTASCILTDVWSGMATLTMKVQDSFLALGSCLVPFAARTFPCSLGQQLPICCCHSFPLSSEVMEANNRSHALLCHSCSCGVSSSVFCLSPSLSLKWISQISIE